MDLNAPLGRTPPPRRRRLMPVAFAAITAALLVGLGVYLLQADPNGGEPYAVATVPPVPAPKPRPIAALPDPTPTGSIAAPAPRDAETATMENGVKVVSPSSPGARATGPLIIDVSKALDEAPRKTGGERLAKTESLPVVTTGLPPVNARAGAARPRVAIMIGGLGLAEVATRTAIETTPAAIDLAFVPVGSNLPASLESARAKGHEILLQIPMTGPQGNAAAPHSLSPTQSAPAMAADLDWLTSRFDGYAGVTNLLGASLTSNTTAMTAVLKAVGRHGVFYVDDGTSRRSLAAMLAGSLDVPAAQADVVLDTTSDAAVVRANLEHLVAIARAKGSAIGSASAVSDHVAAIARFASEADARGFELVPVSRLVHGSPSVATTR